DGSVAGWRSTAPTHCSPCASDSESLRLFDLAQVGVADAPLPLFRAGAVHHGAAQRVAAVVVVDAAVGVHRLHGHRDGHVARAGRALHAPRLAGAHADARGIPEAARELVRGLAAGAAAVAPHAIGAGM